MVIKETTVITTESIPIYPISKRNSKSLDLSINTDNNSIRHHTRSTSDGGSIHTINTVTEGTSLSSVLPISQSNETSPTNASSILFNFGLGVKKTVPSRKQSYCSSINQKVYI